jgi:hypothetical protein
VVFRLREAKATGVQQQDAAATSASGTAAGGSAAPHASAPQVAVLGSPKVGGVSLLSVLLLRLALVAAAHAVQHAHAAAARRTQPPAHAPHTPLSAPA